MLTTKKNDQFDKKVHKFEETKDFLDLLDAIEFALKHRIYDCSKLYDIWSDSKDTICSVDQFEAYSHIIPMFYAYNESVSTEANNKTVDFTLKDSVNKKEALSNAMNLMNEMARTDKELNDRYFDKYLWFRPSWCYGEILSAGYADDINPGIIIAEHLRLLFTDSFPAEIENVLEPFIYNPKYKIPLKSDLYNLILHVGYFVIDNAEIDVKLNPCLKIALRDIFEGDVEVVFPENIKRNDILISILFAPRDFFYSWICSEWSLGDRYNPNLVFDLQLILNHYSIGYGNWPISAVIENDYLGDIKKSYRNKLSDIKTNKYLNFEVLADLLFSSNIRDNSMGGDTGKLMISVLSNLTTFRRITLSGVSPISESCASLIATVLVDRMDAEYIDLAILLAYGDNDCGYLMPDFDVNSSDIPSLIKAYDEREEMYLLLYKKAVDENLPELGNALLSLYLVMRAFHGKFKFGDMSKICKTINEAIKLPGFQCLKQTIKLIVDLSEELPKDPIAQMVGKVFRNYLPQEAKLHLLPGKGEKKSENADAVNPSSIKESMINYLETERWEKLSSLSKQYLLDAETTWRRLYMEFGFGLKDWSGLIILYCNVIENELVERLADFYCSDDLKTYLEAQNRTKPGKATTGWLLKEIENHDKFPVNLKELLKNSKTTLYLDKDLLKSLASLNNYRNIAAHKDPSDMTKLAKFKQIYFENKVIHRFIDALS